MARGDDAVAPGGTWAPVRAWAGEAARRWFVDRHATFWMQRLDPTWAWDEVRARIVAIHSETHDTKTFTLAPNRHWTGHRAGQYVLVGAEIDGARTRRAYSLSSVPGARHPTITVKRVPGGRMSTWLHTQARLGDVLTLEGVAGDFVVPDGHDRPRLFVAGGSGITPFLSMLGSLHARGSLRGTVLVNHARSARDVIGADRLASWVAEGLTLHTVRHDDPNRPRARGVDAVRALVEDLAERDVWVCGPEGLRTAYREGWTEHGLRGAFREERFGVPTRRPASGSAAVSVTMAQGGRVVRLGGEGSLLEQLEAAGDRPAHGCRMGICRACRCRKLSGTVEDRRDGRISSAPDEDIALCVTVPRTDLVLDRA